LFFDCLLTNSIITELSNSQSANSKLYKLVYLGFRPKSTLELHDQFANQDNGYVLKNDTLKSCPNSLVTNYLSMFNK
jgi:hypothetical protein